jgi:hypothetical protein
MGLDERAGTGAYGLLHEAVCRYAPDEIVLLDRRAPSIVECLLDIGIDPGDLAGYGCGIGGVGIGKHEAHCCKRRLDFVHPGLDVLAVFLDRSLCLMAICLGSSGQALHGLPGELAFRI